MSIRLDFLPAGLEEAQFKRDANGWLFTTANPWVFAPRRTYLVTDAQKPALAARVRASRYLRLALLPPLMGLPVAVLLSVPSLLQNPWALGLAMGALVVLITVAITLGDYLMVRPLLRDAPRTSRKIRMADMLRTQSEALSVKALTIFTLIFVLGAASNALSALSNPRTAMFSAIAAAATALFALVFGGMLVAKLKNRKHATSNH